MTAEQKKDLGAYYTKEEVTDSLSRWAIRLNTDTILEPSFGGCNFLTSSLKALQDLGVDDPKDNIFGFDIDKGAFDILREKQLDNGNFFLADFLQQSDLYINKLQAAAVLGNPPYLQVNKLKIEDQQWIKAKFKDSSPSIPSRSSLWVYFIVHSLNYLRKGGRMAWVVPDSIAFTYYGKAFLSQLSKLFKKNYLFRVEERFFSDSGTMEKTAFLLCDGYKIGEGEIETYSSDSLATALSLISLLDQPPTNEKPLIAKPTLEQHKKPTLSSQYKRVTLGSILDIKIGIVLGATDLLTFKKQEGESSPYYPDFLYPVLTKGKQLKGLVIDKSSFLKQEHSPIYLVDAIKMEEQNKRLFTQFKKIFPEEVLNNATFQKRERLFDYDDFRHPDAFFIFYSQKLPKIVINQGRQLNCTNSIHRLYVKNEYRRHKSILKFIAMQTFCDYSADATRNLARPYGNGIIKYEPSDAAQLEFFIPNKVTDKFRNRTNEVFEKVNKLVQREKTDQAKSIIRHFLDEQLFSIKHITN